MSEPTSATPEPTPEAASPAFNDAPEPTAADYAALADVFGDQPESNSKKQLNEELNPNEPAEPNEPDDTDDAEQHGNSEAAKWRVKYRGVQSELAQVREQLTEMQRSQIDAHTAALGIKPAAVWATGVGLEDLLDEGGVPDAEKIATAVKAARDTLGIETPKPPSRGLQSGAMRQQQPRINQWEKAFAPQQER